MEKRQQFFKQLLSSPSLLWKAMAGLLFVTLALLLLFSPSLIYGLEKNTRLVFALLLLIYGLFRLSTFYLEYRQKNEE